MATTVCLVLGALLGCLVAPTFAAEPSFLVAVPSHMRAGLETRVCAMLLNPNETLQMTISLVDEEQKKEKLHDYSSHDAPFQCFKFKAPMVEAEIVRSIDVEVKGETSHWKVQKRIKFSPKEEPMILVQTDKPIYSPGQKVHFRVVSMEQAFIPFQDSYKISMEDSRGNTIGQWFSKDMLQQLSYELNPEAPQGQYKLKVDATNGKATHTFKVKKYVLPKFDVSLSTPEVVSVGQEQLTIKVCARYTFGQPVPGKVSISLCRESSHFSDDEETLPEAPCSQAAMDLEASGCVSHVVDLTKLTRVEFADKLGNIYKVNANVTEEGTDITRSDSKDIRLHLSLGKLAFVDTPNVFEEGVPFEGKIRAIHYNDTGIAHKTIHLFQGHSWNAEPVQNITTDSTGVATFSIDTTSFPPSFELTASMSMDLNRYEYNTPHYDMASHSVNSLRPATVEEPTSSSLFIKDTDTLRLACGKETPITVGYTFVGETYSSSTIDVFYMVLFEGRILQHGSTEAVVKVNEPFSRGEMSFQLNVTPDMVPNIRVLVYCVLPSETVLATSRTFATDRCFHHKVSVEFSPSRAVPGEKGFLKVSGLSGSLCGLSAVDQSVFLLEPDRRLDVDKVFGLKSYWDWNIPYELQDRAECLHVRPKRSSMPYFHGYHGSDSGPAAVFKRLGLQTLTNLVLSTPSCLQFKGNRYSLDFGMPRPNQVVFMERSEGVPFRPQEEFDVTVRKVFPETWIWDTVNIISTGVAQVPVTVPDTITTWETEVFCLSPQGFGLAPATQLTVFQPFFLELSLPYSITRGENFELRATVFNYMPKCIMVTVAPTPSSDFTLTPSGEGQYSTCMCANGRKTFTWTLVPSALGMMDITVSAEAVHSQVTCGNELVTVPEKGQKDIVTRPLLVKAEGTEKTESFNWLLCPKGGSLTEEVDLKLPSTVVPGSARASVSVLGDILGRALKNIDGLLKMPYGCGEQNMAILAPNIYILQYLQNTGRLTAEIKDKAINFLQSGYQRQLNYKHHDGSYSTFGSGSGNTWLTAFVMRSFGQAKAFTYINPEIIRAAKNWLVEKQLRPDGSFRMRGSLFNNRMKGGVNDAVTITAYITVAMLESNMTVHESTKTFLKSSVPNVSSPYTSALLAYTLTLAGEDELRARLLDNLDKQATSEGNLLYWSPSKSERADSLAVETSSYVLLTVVSVPEMTAADLGKASRIVNWLVKQQNPYGGFSSTQDTVVAMQALALYATKVFNAEGSSTVALQSAGGDKHQFDVNQDNSLLYQERALKEVPGKYSIDVKGSSCASVGVALFYNVPTPNEVNPLQVEVKVKPLTEGECNKAHGQSLRLVFTVQYKGSQEITNMVLLDIAMLSGFTADLETDKKSAVDRVEKKDDHILVYFQGILKSLPVTYEMTIKQHIAVNNLKPAVVKVYDYYHPSDLHEVEYSSPCAA